MFNISSILAVKEMKSKDKKIKELQVSIFCIKSTIGNNIKKSNTKKTGNCICAKVHLHSLCTQKLWAEFSS